MSSRFEISLDPSDVIRARDGDRQAQARIYGAFKVPVYSVACRICRNPSEAEEVLQDTFLQAFRRLHQFRGEAPFWAWLRQVAVTTALMRLRREKLRATQGLDESGNPEGGPDGGRMGLGASSSERWQLGMDLEQAMGALPDTARAVVWLYDVEGFTHKEIAEFMGKTVSFSKSQLSRAHARLRDLLETSEAESCTSALKIC